MFRGSEIKYTLGMGIFPERLNQILRRQQLPPNWIAVVFDTSGVIVARTHNQERFVGQRGAEVALKAISERSDGTKWAERHNGSLVERAAKHAPARANKAETG